MILAINGASKVGKSTIARALRDLVQVPLRSCGEEIKAAATARNVSTDKLTDDIHKSVDQETVKWAAENRPCVVEGRYLDYVLCPIQSGVWLIQVRASEDERAKRFSAALGRQVTLPELHGLDEQDRSLITRVFGLKRRLPPDITIDTTRLAAEVCVRLLAPLIPSNTPG